jgi:pyridoxamine 5'-phosphate oxidase
MNRDLSSIRRDYQFEDLLEDQASTDPMQMFDAWLEKAIDACPDDPTAMVLSTVDSEQRPHARVVLLKQRDSQGFSFFTNYDSDKGQQLADNANACLTFFWPALSRQVRIEGKVKKVTRRVSENYFASRPKGSQLAASVSCQSHVVASRDVLTSAFKDLENKYENAPQVPCPDNWGGYVLEANYLEFWQGRPSRLHDRLRYRLIDHQWQLERLAP